VFVIQKHHATNLHYDFRIEDEGVLKSWAVPKGPPDAVGIKRLAIQVEDHGMAWAKFEGVIPKGEYGAGKVEIWDHGRCTILEKTENQICVRLKGNKIKGEYRLVRMTGTNWLLTKL
jgi:DNA ligase D-like protein (predicted 3'-phosphoesterase)